MLRPDSRLGRQLPVRDDPYPDESGNGYALRMACANGISYGELMLLLSAPGNYCLSPSICSHVAYLFGTSTSALHRSVPTRFRDSGQMRILFMEHVFSRTYLVRSHLPQVCPACLSERSYAKAYCELSLATVCVTHHVRLVDRCRLCDRAVRWRRPALTLCFCGADFRDVVPQEVSGLEADFSELLEAKLFSRVVQLQAPLFHVLAGLGISTLMRLVWNAGIRQVMPKSKAVPGKVTRVPDTASAVRIVRSGLAVLNDVVQTSHLSDGDFWSGGEILSDLTSDEINTIDQFFPGLLRDSDFMAAKGVQLPLFERGSY